MDSAEPFAYFNSFEIDISAQSEAINGCDSRISQLRQRLMQFGKVMGNLQECEKEMQHKQQIRAQHALSQEIIILHQSIQTEKQKIKQLTQKANHFLTNQCQNNFIPQTLHFHKILSQKYVESQYDVIHKYQMEINDIKQGIKSNPSQILRLFYILFSIKDILSKIKRNSTDHNAPNLIDDNVDVFEQTPQNKLESIQASLIGHIVGILPAIKRRYLNELQKCLQSVCWPKIGGRKVIDLSSPQKWADIEVLCCDLFGIEYYIQYMNENQILLEITNCVSPTNKNKSWVLDTFLAPIIKRFEYNFNFNVKTNRLDKPQYFLHFILQIIADNLAVLKQVLQPLILQNGLDLDLEKVFIYGLIPMLRLKCRKSLQIFAKLLNETLRFKETYSKGKELYLRSANITKTAMKGMKVMSEISAQSLHSLYSSFKLFKPETKNNEMEEKYTEHNEEKIENKEKNNIDIDEDDTKTNNELKMKRIQNENKYTSTKYLIQHLINEMIAFQTKLIQSYPWTAHELETNIICEILDIKIIECEWLLMEKESINKNSLLINTKSDIEIFDILHSDFLQRQQQNENYYLTHATYDILTILERISLRMEAIIDMKYRYQFAQELIFQLLTLCLQFIEQQFPNHIHYRMGMNAKEINVCCGMINSTHYLAQFLSKWNEKISFKALSYYLQINEINEIEIIATEQWLLSQAKILKLTLKNNGFFKDFIVETEALCEKHMAGLADVMCHEFVLDCSQYLNETFGYIQYVEKEINNNIERGSIAAEFEDGYYKLCDLLYACFKSLPLKLFEKIRKELSANIDDKLFEKILNINVSFYYSASQQLKYDLQHMFALFYVEDLFLIPNYKPMDINILFVEQNIANKFPKLTALLVIVTMNKMQLNEFMDVLGIKMMDITDNDEVVTDSLSGIDKEMTFEQTRQVLQRYSVDALTEDKIKKIIKKMNSLQNRNKDGSDNDSEFSDF